MFCQENVSKIQGKLDEALVRKTAGKQRITPESGNQKTFSQLDHCKHSIEKWQRKASWLIHRSSCNTFLFYFGLQREIQTLKGKNSHRIKNIMYFLNCFCDIKLLGYGVLYSEDISDTFMGCVIH